MKYIQIKQIFFCIACCCLFSCSDALDKAPLTQISNSTAWETEDGAMLVLTGAYRGTVAYNAEVYSQDDWWGYYGLVYLELASDNALDRRRTGSPIEQLINGTLTSSNATILQYWKIAFVRISRSNDVIANIDKVPMDEAKKARMKAEARFIRATQYFYLSTFFGDVPLVTKPITPQEANNLTKTSKADITNWMIQEFSEAANALPRYKEMNKGTEWGRASKQAALAFLGRVQLADKRFADAAATYKQIIDFGDNSIDPDYKTLFLASNEKSNENIFSTSYLIGSAGNPIAQQSMPSKDGGWCFFCPTGNMFEAYQFTNGENFSYTNPLYDPTNLEKNRDPRLAYTLICNGTIFRGSRYVSHPDSTGNDVVSVGLQRTQTGFLLRKYMEESILNVWLPSGFENDIPIIRYAEVLLSYLEAKLEAGDPIDQTLLNATINQIRGRASVHMPPITETNPTKLRTILRNERRVELAMEGIRYWDLMRWGVAHEILQGKVWGCPFPGAKNANTKNDPYNRWDTQITRAFRNPQDYRWPTPQSEQDINPNLRN